MMDLLSSMIPLGAFHFCIVRGKWMQGNQRIRFLAKASGSFLVIGSREFQSKKLTFSSVLSGNTKVNSGTKTASGSSQKAHNGKARKAHGQCFSYFSWLLHVLSQSHLTNPNSASEIVFFLSFSYFFLFGFPMCCHNPWLGGAPYNTVSPVMYDHQLKF